MACVTAPHRRLHTPATQHQLAALLCRSLPSRTPAHCRAGQPRSPLNPVQTATKRRFVSALCTSHTPALQCRRFATQESCPKANFEPSSRTPPALLVFVTLMLRGARARPRVHPRCRYVYEFHAPANWNQKTLVEVIVDENELFCLWIRCVGRERLRFP